jgi:hypothetical protein
MRTLVNRQQLALFGPSPAERERQRLHVLEGHAGMPARERLVRRDRGRIIEREYEPPLRDPWHPTPETPLRPRRMLVVKPEKPFGRMTDAEIDEFAARFVRGMAEQVAKARVDDESGPDRHPPRKLEAE